MTNVQRIIDLYKEGKISESTIVKMAAFKDELTKHAMNESIANFLKWLAMGMTFTAGAGVVAGGIHAATNAIEKAKVESEKKPNFNKMLAMHPDLRENQNQAWQYYESLYHFSPVIATDPLTAGAYVRQAIRMHDTAGGPLTDVVQRLVDIQQKHRDSEKKFMSPVQTAASGLMGLPTVNIPGMKDISGI